ncbi:hypothetical protein ACJEHO_03870 [Legionella pneumophila]|nr:hypothetical protein [Legionella pneumophila]CZP13771.1 Uncharacterised protein [Legionella pneumophila]HAT2037646.1 hypothetical protein [Legionella pneumophila]HAT7747973.1 hypothetical protein [Legionella pneumophila]HAT7761116.1 hypothetical protein [Legionella pneumophila]HAW6259056.1 hypothetical protein [Legionella pneumophila]
MGGCVYQASRLVGGYLALHFARNANSKAFSENNPEPGLEQSVLSP